MSSDRTRIHEAHSILRFKFSDHRFAKFAREHMYEILVQFDANHNLTFEEDEIRNVLTQIFGQKPEEQQYVTKNVHRFDRDGDGKVTYKEFVDFMAEMHFGEIAIQRLHRQKVFSQGSKRIMNLPQFIKTMEYSLNPLGIEGPQDIYQLLFQEVDLDRDGFISYEDYFVFLREYFGSQSDAGKEEPPSHPINEPKQLDFPLDNGAAERFARLIYSQLKITVMQVDGSKKLRIQRPQVEYFIQQLLQVTGQNNTYIVNLALQNRDSLTYEEFLQYFVPFFFCEFFVTATGVQNGPINEQMFVQLVTEASSSIVAVPPSEKTLRSIYYMATGEGGSELSLEQYVMLLSNMLENYNFDKRGLAHDLHRS